MNIATALKIPPRYLFSDDIHDGLTSDECLDIMRYNAVGHDHLAMTTKQADAAKGLLCDILGIEYKIINEPSTVA